MRLAQNILSKTFMGLLSLSLFSCSHQKLSSSPVAFHAERFHPKEKSNYVLDSEITLSIANVKGHPIIQVDLPRSNGCQIWLDQEYPGVVYPEHITNNVEKLDPMVFVLKYESRCMNERRATFGDQSPLMPHTSQINLYNQIIDSKLEKFKSDFESGILKIAVCRYWECSDLISYQDSLQPKIFFRSEYKPPQTIDLKLAELKPIRNDVPLVEAIYGPAGSVCDGRLKQGPTLAMSLFLSSMPKKLASSHQEFPNDYRYIFKFYKGQLITKEKANALAQAGEVFCSLRVIETKSKSAQPIDAFEFAPIQAIAYASNLGATFYNESDKSLLLTQYFSRTFELFGKITQNQITLSGGFCSSPHGDLPNGRQIFISDLIEHIPGVTLSTNYPGFYLNSK
jgi:hypothetical protein